MHEAIILDFDGVILQSEPIHYQAYNTLLSEYNIVLSEKEYFAEYAGLSDKELFPKLFENKNVPLRQTQMSDLILRKVAIYKQLIQGMIALPLIQGLGEYLRHARKLFKKLAICSGATEAEVMVVLNKLYQQKIVPPFDVIVTAQDVQCGKPSPEGYLLTAQRLGISPTQCMVVEDSPHGIDAGKKAGMYVVALATTFNPSLLQQADVIFTDFVQLSGVSV
ncbi:MAG: Haloacid dehalogenase superfamily, subfamily [Gammaproteobacteria bacterium]|jgi:beta-phosphoglucomutase|nr:Haloacid dehalogenase superfamily, subfamily [Gammaproteobacteria bacterium]